VELNDTVVERLAVAETGSRLGKDGSRRRRSARRGSSSRWPARRAAAASLGGAVVGEAWLAGHRKA
jgi:hypothetical protein